LYFATLGKVRYTAAWPGIDLAYYGNQRQMKYGFVVAPGPIPTRDDSEDRPFGSTIFLGGYFPPPCYSSAPSMRSGKASAALSKRSRQTNLKTISPTQAITSTKREVL
jgi:hypothetical protein